MIMALNVRPAGPGIVAVAAIMVLAIQVSGRG
jgi:hypothetical protein